MGRSGLTARIGSLFVWTDVTFAVMVSNYLKNVFHFEASTVRPKGLIAPQRWLALSTWSPHSVGRRHDLSRAWLAPALLPCARIRETCQGRLTSLQQSRLAAAFWHTLCSRAAADRSLRKSQGSAANPASSLPEAAKRKADPVPPHDLRIDDGTTPHLCGSAHSRLRHRRLETREFHNRGQRHHKPEAGMRVLGLLSHAIRGRQLSIGPPPNYPRRQRCDSHRSRTPVRFLQPNQGRSLRH